MDVYTLPALDETAVGDLVAWGMTNGRWRWLYGEAETGVELAYLAGMDWRLWPHGRAFGEQAELAWWRQADGRYQLRLALETGSLPTITGITWGSPETWWVWEPEAARTLLHGRYDVGRSQEIGQASWSEARIPRWLHYPVSVDAAQPKPELVRAVLLTQSYRQQDGLVGLTRVVGLETWQPSEETANGQ
jgi:hypothetical protein